MKRITVEAEVRDYLIGREWATATLVSKRLRLHRSSVYSALRSLHRGQVVERVGRGVRGDVYKFRSKERRLW